MLFLEHLQSFDKSESSSDPRDSVRSRRNLISKHPRSGTKDKELRSTSTTISTSDDRPPLRASTKPDKQYMSQVLLAASKDARLWRRQMTRIARITQCSVWP